MGGPAERIRILGEEIDLVTPSEVMAFVAERVAAGRKGIVANHNAHSFVLLRKDARMRPFFERADIIEIDSAPLIFWGALTRKPIRTAHRSTYLDWRNQFWPLAASRGWKVFYLGGHDAAAQEAARRLTERWPGVELAVQGGFFDVRRGSAENEAVLERINAFAPDVLLVGMGMPLQEIWIAENFDSLASGVAISVGAAFDYEAGVQTPAPRWMGPLGIEWLFRLATQPKRLAYRYLVEPWSLLPAMAQDVAEALGRKPRPPIRTPAE